MIPLAFIYFCAVLFILLILGIFMLMRTRNRWQRRTKAQVIRVCDGDTFVARTGWMTFRVRLAGMDAPEHNQTAGTEATAYLKLLLTKKTVRILPLEKDQYGRTVAVVDCNGVDVSEKMIRAGLAWPYEAYFKNLPEHTPERYRFAGQLARSERIGLWSKPRPVPPWEFRQTERRRRRRRKLTLWLTFATLLILISAIGAMLVGK